MHSALPPFSSIWAVVVAVEATGPGEKVAPLVLAAKDLSAADVVELGMPKLGSVRQPPYPTGPQALLVTIDANDLAAFHLALGWRLPERVLDLWIEFRNATNGRRAPIVGGLAGALLWFGLSTAGALLVGTSPCRMRSRLEALSDLFRAMQPSLDLPRALLRGRYMVAVGQMEAIGIPADTDQISRLSQNWHAIRDHVVKTVDLSYGVYQDGLFNVGAFERWLADAKIDWPRLHSGLLDLNDDTFSELSRAHPILRPLKELRSTLVAFDPRALAIGRDGRNRTRLRPFAARTGRNQPSARASLLCGPGWVRHLIRPEPGASLAMIDWQQQEFGIAAALSGDAAMQEAYSSGDPYIALAISAGAAPPEATGTSYPIIRASFKHCALGVQYGMGPRTLARQLQIRETEAHELLRSHRAAFPTFWSWSDKIESVAILEKMQQSAFGWSLAIRDDSNPRALRNFPMQSNGAEMLRLACCLAIENGIRVCAPHHDALLIEAPRREVDQAIRLTQRLMAEASAVVLGGFALRTSVRCVRSPACWSDPRGKTIWAAVQHALLQEEPIHQRHATCSPANSRSISLYPQMKDAADVAD